MRRTQKRLGKILAYTESVIKTEAGAIGAIGVDARKSSFNIFCDDSRPIIFWIYFRAHCMKKRTRECNNPEQRGKGKQCEGPSFEEDKCQLKGGKKQKCQDGKTKDN